MEILNTPTKDQIEEAVKTLSGGFYHSSDIHYTLTEAYRFIAEMKLQHEDNCYGSPQQAADHLLVLRTMADTIKSAR